MTDTIIYYVKSLCQVFSVYFDSQTTFCKKVAEGDIM